LNSRSHNPFLCSHRVIRALRHPTLQRYFAQIANIVVLAPLSATTQVSSSTPLQTLSNGHTSPLANTTLTNDDAPYDSESDLSEVAIPIIDEPSPANSIDHQSELGAQGTEDSESSPEEAQGESDDADFDIEENPTPAATNGGRHDRSTSTESRRPAKRKLGVEEDEHILANPELYGLRRSVR